MSKLYRVFGRTKLTDWVELNAFDGEDAEENAKQLVKHVLDSGSEAMMEIEEDFI